MEYLCFKPADKSDADKGKVVPYYLVFFYVYVLAYLDNFGALEGYVIHS